MAWISYPFIYDTVGRLSQVQPPNDAELPAALSREYDANGSPQRHGVGGIGCSRTYSYAGSDFLAEMAYADPECIPGSIAYTAGPSGEVLTAGTTSFSYQADSGLTTAVTDAAVDRSVSYRYYGGGANRLQKTIVTTQSGATRTQSLRWRNFSVTSPAE